MFTWKHSASRGRDEIRSSCLIRRDGPEWAWASWISRKPCPIYLAYACAQVLILEYLGHPIILLIIWTRFLLMSEPLGNSTKQSSTQNMWKSLCATRKPRTVIRKTIYPPKRAFLIVCVNNSTVLMGQPSGYKLSSHFEMKCNLSMRLRKVGWSNYKRVENGVILFRSNWLNSCFFLYHFWIVLWLHPTKTNLQNVFGFLLADWGESVKCVEMNGKSRLWMLSTSSTRRNDNVIFTIAFTNLSNFQHSVVVGWTQCCAQNAVGVRFKFS